MQLCEGGRDPLADGGTNKLLRVRVAILRIRPDCVSMDAEAANEVPHAAYVPAADVAPLGRRRGSVLDPVCEQGQDEKGKDNKKGEEGGVRTNESAQQ